MPGSSVLLGGMLLSVGPEIVPQKRAVLQCELAGVYEVPTHGRVDGAKAVVGRLSRRLCSGHGYS